MVDPITRQHHAHSPMWQAFLIIVVLTAAHGIAGMMNCLQDLFLKHCNGLDANIAGMQDLNTLVFIQWRWQPLLAAGFLWYLEGIL